MRASGEHRSIRRREDAARANSQRLSRGTIHITWYASHDAYRHIDDRKPYVRRQQVGERPEDPKLDVSDGILNHGRPAGFASIDTSDHIHLRSTVELS